MALPALPMSRPLTDEDAEHVRAALDQFLGERTAPLHADLAKERLVYKSLVNLAASFARENISLRKTLHTVVLSTGKRVLALEDALAAIATSSTRVVMPWTHEIAADAYSRDLEAIRRIARDAYEKGGRS